MIITQDEYDSSCFCADEDVCAMGEEFNPEAFEMTLDEMLSFIDEGIKYFNALDMVLCGILLTVTFLILN